MSSMGSQEKLTVDSILSEPGDGYIEANGVCYRFHLQYQVCNDKEHKHSQESESFLEQKESDNSIQLAVK